LAARLAEFCVPKLARTDVSLQQVPDPEFWAEAKRRVEELEERRRAGSSGTSEDGNSLSASTSPARTLGI
jgi:hypothetical protein